MPDEVNESRRPALDGPKVVLSRPPKPHDEMTDEDYEEWARQLLEAMRPSSPESDSASAPT